MNHLKQNDLELKKKQKVNYLCAMDETGRGSMASIFVAACVILPDNFFNEKINDSKKLSESTIADLAKEIKENAIFYEIIEFEAKYIDEVGIQYVNIKAFEFLKEKTLEKFDNCLFLADGNIMQNKIGFLSLVKGDSISFSVACASIIAKDYRDNHLKIISELYPNWNLDKNKGYGQDYIENCKKFGYPDIHRKSYKIKDEKQIKFF
jgi:ribonuclease HII